MNRLILAAALVMVSPSALAHDRPATSSAVHASDAATAPAIAVVEAFHTALGAGDADAVLALLAEDVVVLETGGAERSREEYAGHHLPADMAFAAATTDEVTRRAAWVRGDIAWVLTEGRTTGTFNDRPVNSVNAETMILHRSADGWRIRHIHWSSRNAR